ncbi:hypothetical protein F511_23786 [Dorcoceras hygrometricum]|uniref:Uncharacterized protein n=1 Tax=Dorcoceras hygrometricum TaxID=472368 RepID=A0A2Z7D9H3_9LAMI|nr:hypothetical protein F511_23786 [Dorcoceras hygrometricum]
MRRRPSFPPRALARATTMRVGHAWRLEVALHDAQPLRMRLADDAQSLRRSLARRWPMLEALVDVGRAPVARRSAHLCCDAVRLVVPAGRTKRRWLDALRDLAAAAGRGVARRWMRAAMRPCGARDFRWRPPAGRRSGESPAMS